MQAIKEKIHDMNEMRKVKAEVSKEEREMTQGVKQKIITGNLEERELAKARIEVAHEVRLAKEAEAAMDLHVNKAAEKARKHEEKYPSRSDHQILANASNDSSFGPNSSGGHSDRIFSDADGTTLSLEGSPGNHRGSSAAATIAGITGNPANSTAGGPTITD